MTRTNQPSASNLSGSSRRRFLQQAGKVGVACALAGHVVPAVHAGEENTIRLALIGCGGRGSGAVRDAMRSPNGPVQLYVMADLIEKRLEASYRALEKQFADRMNVPPERRFIGFDAYKKAIDSLRPGDVAMLTGYAAWRPLQLEYAVEKGINVFMEKSFACDPPGVRRVIAAGEKAKKKNLKIAAGLMCRHSRGRHALIDRIRQGDLGDIWLIRANRMQPVGFLPPKPPQQDELIWQVRNFVRFFWVSGGLFSEMTIHQIDEVCWLKDALPVSAHGIGGRAPSNDDCAQNLDSYSIEYTFADGTKALVCARYLRNCFNQFATFVHGSKCAAQFSGNIHADTIRMYKDQRIAPEYLVWKPEPDPCSPWQAEWNDLLDAIRNDRPYNEARRAALSNLAAIMGRAAVHSGQVITWDQAMKSDFRFYAGTDEMDYDTKPPLAADENGRYPAPSPGQWTEI